MICSKIKRAALYLVVGKVRVYRLWKFDHFLTYWFTLKPGSIEAEGRDGAVHHDDHFDVRWLARTCAEGAAVEKTEQGRRMVIDRAITEGKLTKAWIKSRHEADQRTWEAERAARAAERAAWAARVAAGEVEELPF